MFNLRRWFATLSLLMLSACAGFGGDVPAGPQRLVDVERQMGVPAMRWRAADGSETLVYPRGPMGFQTYFVRGNAAGQYVQREGVLDTAHFARIQAGMTPEEVMRVLGPPVVEWTVYFKARDELVWEWRYCDDWSEPARFNVLFDGSTQRVRSTQTATEQLRGILGIGNHRVWCSR
ncbi:MAG: hypothetical protein L6Q40_06530 [Azonexus sp.]|nr:hypothetical protein [Azonexus sp.]